MEFDLGDGAKATLRMFENEDAVEVDRVFHTLYVTPVDHDQLREDIAHGHAVVAMVGEQMVGYRLQRHMAADVLGDGAMLVVDEMRGKGLGRALVDYFEATVPSGFKVSVVINSDGYDTIRPKAPALGFWLNCGYRLFEETDSTRLLVKRFTS